MLWTTRSSTAAALSPKRVHYRIHKTESGWIDCLLTCPLSICTQSFIIERPTQSISLQHNESTEWCIYWHYEDIGCGWNLQHCKTPNNDRLLVEKLLNKKRVRALEVYSIYYYFFVYLQFICCFKTSITMAIIVKFNQASGNWIKVPWARLNAQPRSWV